MPGNRLPLAVQIGREIDGIALVRQPLELLDYLLLARQDLVMGTPAMFGVDTHAPNQLIPLLLLLVLRLLFRRHLAGDRRLLRALLGIAGLLGRTAGRQITNMPDTRFHHEIVAEILVDGLGLGRRLDDNQ